MFEHIDYLFSVALLV